MTTHQANALPTDIVRGIRCLEPLPATAQRLVEMVNGKDVSLAAVAALIEHDAAVTASVLRHASSARLAVHGALSVREAVVRMGTAALLDVVLDGYLKKLRQATPLYDLTEHDLWLHAAASRLAVQAIRVECPRAQIPASADTAALVHDIGKLVVARHLKCDVREILAYARTHETTFVAAERALLGTDHATVGGAIAEHWHFPADIADAVARHHSAPFERSTPTLDAVMLANVAAKTIAAGLGAEGLNFAVDPGGYRRLGLDFARFSRVCLATDLQLKAVMAAQGVKAA